MDASPAQRQMLEALTRGSVPQIVNFFEQACADASTPSTRLVGEQLLLEIRRHVDAVPIAMHVLQYSSSALARFHAASALRALVSEDKWPPEGHQQHGDIAKHASALRDQLIQITLDRLTAGNGFVAPFERKTIFTAAAAAARRAYLCETLESRNSFFGHIWPMLAHPSSRLLAAELLQALIDELVVTSVSRIPPRTRRAGGPNSTLFEAARATRLRFAREGDLAMIFSKVAEAANTTITERTTQDIGDVLGALMGICASILASNFGERAISLDDCGIASGGGDALKDKKTRDMNQGVAAIGRKAAGSWRGLLGNMSAFVELLFQCWDIARKLDCEPASSACRSCFVLLCGLHPGSLLDSSAYLMNIIGGAESRDLSKSADAADRLAYAEGWWRLVSIHGTGRLAGVGGPQLLEHFVANTLRHVRLPYNPHEEEQWENDCRDLLLETWATIATEANSITEAIPIQQHLSLILRGFIEVQLLHMNETASGFDKDFEEEEDAEIEDLSIEEARLEALAVLARLSAKYGSVEFIAKCLSDRATKMSNPPADHSEIRRLQDELYWLVSLSAWVLADDASGETPMVPESLLVANGASNSSPLHLLQALIHCVEGESALIVSRGAFSNEVSPLVGRALCDALCRISQTYLVPAEGAPAIAASQAIDGNAAAAGRQISLRKAIEALLYRGGDSHLCSSASALLLTLAGGLSSDRKQPFEDLRNPEIWSPVANTVSDSSKLVLLPASAVRDLGEAVALVYASGMRQLVESLLSQLRTLCAGGQNDNSSTILVVLNLLRGIARCGHRDRSTLSVMGSGLSDPIGKLLKTYENRDSPVPRNVIKLLEQIAASNLVYMSPAECAGFFQECLSLIENFLASLQTYIQSLSEDAVVSSVISVLKLLSRLLDKDAVDFSDLDGTQTDVEVAQVVYYGCSHVMPFVTEELLCVPRLADTFFGLVTDLVALYPEKMDKVPPTLSSQLLHSLDISLSHSDESTARRGLRAIGALADYSAKLPQADRTLLVALQNFMCSLLASVVEGSATEDQLSDTADVLLPLIRCDPSGQMFTLAAEGILTRSRLPETTSAQIAARLRQLYQSAQQTMAEASQPGNRGRAARGAFREQVLAFSQQIKSLFVQATDPAVS